MTFLHVPIKKSLLSGPAADYLLDILTNLTRIQRVTDIVISADLGYAVCSLHV